MQLPPLIKKMPLQQLNGEFKGDISAALTKSASDKVTPLMTPIAQRSVRKPARLLSSIATPKTASKVATMPSSFASSTSSSVMDVDVESASADTSKLDIFSSVIVSQFTGKQPMSDAEKLATLAKLKKDIALIEKSISAASKQH
jgi:hypothetical protein